jgi:hypothetical protein
MLPTFLHGPVLSLLGWPKYSPALAKGVLTMPKKRASTEISDLSNPKSGEQAGTERSTRTSEGGDSKSQAADEQDGRDAEVARQFMRSLGIHDPGFYAGFLKQLVIANSDGKHCDEIDSKFDLGYVQGVKPRDQVEAAQAMQMAIVHRLAIGVSRRLSNAKSLQELEIYERIFTRLVRTHSAGMGALKFYRTRNDPEVTVQHVSVRDGGQAVIGKITQHGRTAPDTALPPLAITEGTKAPMPMVEKPEPEAELLPAHRKREE